MPKIRAHHFVPPNPNNGPITGLGISVGKFAGYGRLYYFLRVALGRRIYSLEVTP